MAYLICCQYLSLTSPLLSFRSNDGEQAEQQTDAGGSPSLIAQVEAAMEDDVDQEESEDVTFMKNYRWIIVSLFGMVILLMGGFTQGFTRIKAGELLGDNLNASESEDKSGDESEDKSGGQSGDESEDVVQSKTADSTVGDAASKMFWDFLSRLKADESVVEERHRAIAQILMDLQRNTTDCIMLDESQRFNNKTERDNRYLKLVAEGLMEDDKDTFERKLVDRVTEKEWPVIELSDFGVDDIADEHWDMASYITDAVRCGQREEINVAVTSRAYIKIKRHCLFWIDCSLYAVRQNHI